FAPFEMNISPHPSSSASLEEIGLAQSRSSGTTARNLISSPSMTIATPEGAGRYFARILQQHLVDDPESRYWITEGTAAFVDISGFTKLSERLGRKGREGAKQITEAIGSSFDAILHVAYANGGSLLKFGGDALLIW